MLKPDLVRLILEQHPNLYLREVEQVVEAILEAITDAMARGDRVELRGFGAFSVRRFLARVGRNPRTQATLAVKKKVHPFFKCGGEMRRRLNRSTVLPPPA